MMRNIAVAGAWYLSITAAVGQATLPPTAPTGRSWTEPRRHFVFSSIVFDIDNRAWWWGPRWEPLTDCSTERWHCLASQTFRIVLPRRCADLEAGRWTAGNIHTEIVHRHVASSPPIHGSGSATTLYLGSPERPSQLFAYDPSIGLTALYWDESGRTDFIALARTGEIVDWLMSLTNGPTRRRFYFRLMTVGRVGMCR